MQFLHEVHVLPITTKYISLNLVFKGLFQNPKERKVPLSYLLWLTEAGSALNPDWDVSRIVVLVASISESSV
jgi:hypothetical protein